MLKKPESLNYNTSIPGDEKKNIVMNVYQSGIGEVFIALQLDLECNHGICNCIILDVSQKGQDTTCPRSFHS